MGSVFARAHVTPSWSICQDSGWRSKFRQRRGAGDASAGRWTRQSVSGQGAARGEDWLSQFSSKVLWAGPGRAHSAPLPSSLLPIPLLPAVVQILFCVSEAVYPCFMYKHL